jgi:glycosyltransferase involved in cell wall biosynthesis
MRHAVAGLRGVEDEATDGLFRDGTEPSNLTDMARLRIGILGSRGFPSTYGGFETLVRRLAPYLVERGHDVTVYGRDWHFREGETFEEGVRVVNTPGLGLKSASTFTHGVTGAVHASRARLDAVLVLNVANGIALPMLRRRGVPALVNVDGIEWERGKWGFAARTAFRLGALASARYADRLIADAREIQRIWRDDFKVDSEFIAYGADVLDNVGTGRLETLGLKPGTFALAVARLAPENNVEMFVDACESHPEIRAVVVGDANYKNPLVQRLHKLHRDGNVLWLGHVSDPELLNELWAHCGAYFHGHSVGGTNPALLQALGAGAPTIAVETPFNFEVLGGPEQLVRADTKRVADQLVRLLGDETLQAEFAERGKAIVRERYQWSAVCAAYEAALVNAAKSRAA